MNKEEWILNYIKNSSTKDTNILSVSFIDEYVEIFKPKKIKYKLWGADYIPELSRLLTKMYNKNLLDRQVYGLTGLWQGFPKWVYIYSQHK